nr:integrase, catalytic region, zinc finger, CCHC-type, peptidase aspartic, catalytic [Tanacetum cinerariifolium]
CQVVEKECDQVENSKVIAPGMIKLNLDTFSSVRRPKQSSVIWKQKRSSNTSNVDLSSISHSKLNKDVKRYSSKDLLSCNNSHLGETSKMHFRKNHRDSMNVRSKSNSNKSLPRTVHKWLRKIQPLAKPVAKWIPRVEHCPDLSWIINSGCSKHMTGNHDLLTNFVEKFLGTVRFGNNDFAVIAGYGDVVIGSLTIKKVYYVEGLRYNLFSVGQFCDKGLEVAFRKCRCSLLNDYEDVGKLKEKEDIRVFVGYSKESAAFRIYNKRTRKIHESVNVNFDEISEMASKQFILEPGLSNLNETRKSSNPSVSQVSESSKKDLEDLFQNFYDEYFDSSKIMKSSTTNVETSNIEIPSNEEEVVYESFESFQEESSSLSLNNDVQ